VNDFKIAIIDDDIVFAKTLKELFKKYEVDVFAESLMGINAVLNNDYDILILDYFVDSLNGADIVKRIRELNNEIFIVLLTGYSEEIPAIEALESLKIQDYCEKDVENFDHVLVRIKSAINSVTQIKQMKNTNNELFSAKLKMLRELNNEMQNDLASVIGVSRQTICGYECGRSEPGFDILKRICKHYKVSTDFILSHKL
jgi:DNA-binding response OmpR family regulator